MVFRSVKYLWDGGGRVGLVRLKVCKGSVGHWAFYRSSDRPIGRIDIVVFRSVKYLWNGAGRVGLVRLKVMLIFRAMRRALRRFSIWMFRHLWVCYLLYCG